MTHLPGSNLVEDSILFRALCCVPVLGAIPLNIEMFRLADKIKEINQMPVENQEKSRRLLCIRHIDYIKANYIHGIVCTAIAVALCSSGILTITANFFLFSGGLLIIASKYHKLQMIRIR